MMVGSGLYYAFRHRVGDIVYYQHSKRGQCIVDGPYRIASLDTSNPSYNKAKLVHVDRPHKVFVEEIGVIWLLPAQIVNTSGFRATARLPVLPERGKVIDD